MADTELQTKILYPVIYVTAEWLADGVLSTLGYNHAVDAVERSVAAGVECFLVNGQPWDAANISYDAEPPPEPDHKVSFKEFL